MENSEEFLWNDFGERLKLKETSIVPPTQYLGNKVSQVTLDNGTKCWSFSSSQYIQNAVKNVEEHLARKGERLPQQLRPLGQPAIDRKQISLLSYFPLMLRTFNP